MFIILSQKVDGRSTYSDALFQVYHYPSRYKNQLHQGDIFVYYQGNRYEKGQRYYFGTGTIGKIQTDDGENYYAELIGCRRFPQIVPIYLPDGGYIEQLGYEKIRKSINPPWQSSVRPLSADAYTYILNAAGVPVASETGAESIDSLREKLKTAVKEFYVGDDSSAIFRIEDIAMKISQSIGTQREYPIRAAQKKEPLAVNNGQNPILDYCKDMKMSYSYKPILISALLSDGDGDGNISIQRAVKFFSDFYRQRRAQGKPAERRKCIYLRDDATGQEIKANIIATPVKALVESGLFCYEPGSEVFSMRPDIWMSLTDVDKALISETCNQRLEEYFSR